MSIRCLIAPLTVAVLLGAAGSVHAQGAFPAPLPAGVTPAPKSSPFPPVNGAGGNSPFPPVNTSAPANSPFPPVNAAPNASVGGPSPFPSGGAAPIAGGGAFSAPPQAAGPSAGQEECMNAFMPLRKEAERRGALIKAASDRRASAAEACKLIGDFSQAELKMINYVRANQQKCGIPSEVTDQLNNGRKNTQKMQRQVCSVAQQQSQQPRGPAGPSLSDVLGSSAAMPAPTGRGRHGGSTFDTLSGNVLTR